jgi:putative exporter of polyketide antibiotics
MKGGFTIKNVSLGIINTIIGIIILIPIILIITYYKKPESSSTTEETETSETTETDSLTIFVYVCIGFASLNVLISFISIFL